MKRERTSAWIAVAMLAAAGMLTPAVAADEDEELLAVPADQIEKLWVRTRGDNEAELFGRMKYRAGCATVSFIIERDGKMSSLEVLRSFPDDEFGAGVRDMLRKWRFEPTPLNKERMPIYSLRTFTVTMPGYQTTVGSNIKADVDLDKLYEACAVKTVQFGGS